MKRALFTLLTLATTALGVERPKGFIGLPWGASPEEAKRALGTRSGVEFPENTDDYHMEVTGGSFAGQPVAKWVLDFPERKFASASVTLKLEGNANSVYKDLRKELGLKYGSPSSEKKLSSSGSKSVKRAGEYRQSSYGSMATWKFSPNLKNKESLVVTAELSDGKGNATNSEEALTVTIRYHNETLMPKAEDGGKATAPIKKEDL